jgi:hypothetical protein
MFIRRLDLRGLHKQHFVCFSCRKRFKQRGSEGEGFESTERNAKCPQCAEPMVAVGRDFHCPPARDRRQWLKVELLYLFGIDFAPGWFGPGHAPKELAHVVDFLVTKGRARQEVQTAYAALLRSRGLVRAR